MRGWILLGMTILLGSGLLYVVFVHEPPRLTEQASFSPNLNLTLQQVVVREQRLNTVEWIVRADSAVYFESKHQALLKPVRFQMFQTGSDHPQAVDIRGQADQAFVDQAQDLVVLNGNAHVLEGANTEIQSGTLQFLQRQDLVESKGPTSVRRGDMVMQGSNMRYSIPQEHLEMDAPHLMN